MRLIGLDFGSTTSSMVLASMEALKNHVTGKIEFSEVKVLFRADPVFTPFLGNEIDEVRLKALLEDWFARAGFAPDSDLAGGGAIVTGLAAQKENAVRITNSVRSFVGDAVIAVADDPCLESWVSFMGNCHGLSLANPKVPFLNFDIGGGTTNVALGVNGEVIHSSCLWIGARHFQFKPGGYQILEISSFGRDVLDQLGILKSVGDCLEELEIDAIVTHDVKRLEELVQKDWHNDWQKTSPVITFSGGVGELIYKLADEIPMPSQTFYGDLGIDLAKKIYFHSSILSAHLKTHQPHQKGRATVYGLMLHSTQLSGQTLYLERAELLPLRDIPILGSLSWNGREGFGSQLDMLLQRGSKSKKGACFRVVSLLPDLDHIREFSRTLRESLVRNQFPENLPLILLVSQNIGKTLGHYITGWGEYPANLMIVDEVVSREASFLSLGKLQNGVVPVSFYGS